MPAFTFIPDGPISILSAHFGRPHSLKLGHRNYAHDLLMRNITLFPASPRARYRLMLFVTIHIRVSPLSLHQKFPCLDYFNHRDVIPARSLCRKHIRCHFPDTDRNSQPRNEGVKHGRMGGGMGVGARVRARVIACRLADDCYGSAEMYQGVKPTILVLSIVFSTQ